MLALPFLRDNDMKRFWPILKNGPNIKEYSEKLTIRNEITNFTDYIEKEWLRKSGKLFNFNKLIRTRGTNSAESYHSLLKK